MHNKLWSGWATVHGAMWHHTYTFCDRTWAMPRARRADVRYFFYTLIGHCGCVCVCCCCTVLCATLMPHHYHRRPSTRCLYHSISLQTFLFFVCYSFALFVCLSLRALILSNRWTNFLNWFSRTMPFVWNANNAILVQCARSTPYNPRDRQNVSIFEVRQMCNVFNHINIVEIIKRTQLKLKEADGCCCWLLVIINH